MKLGLLGGGTIARLVLQHLKRGEIPSFEVVAVAGRGPQSRAVSLAREYSVPCVTGAQALRDTRPDVVLEAASHEAVREHLVPMLDAGVSVIVLSAGALVDDKLRAQAEQSSARSGALFYVPSGGIGGLDVLKVACIAGVSSVSIQVAKPPAAWRGIAYVEAMGIDLEALDGPRTLFEGSAREGVPHFPQNVNIAAILALAGRGFDETRLKIVADPALTLNTHTIEVAGASGRFRVVLENVPAPENPKTSWLACYSALAALREIGARHRYGT
jgi:aspartate dehydrogenase